MIDVDGWIEPAELFELLMTEDLSARAKVLILLLSLTEDGGKINQEELSKTLGGHSDTVRKVIEEAERAGYLDVDRTCKPHWYRVTR